MLVITVNGHKYSRKPFPSYKFRARISFEKKGVDYIIYLDVYTTNPSQEETFEQMKLRTLKNVKIGEIVLWRTKESEDANSEIIDLIP